MTAGERAWTAGMGLAALMFAGCSSQDFSRTMGGVTDSASRPTVTTTNTAVLAAQRADDLARALSIWDTQRQNTELDYRVGPDDVLEIGVFALETPGKTTTLTRPISREGMLDLPLVGPLPVAGLTTPQVAARLTDAYRRGFLNNPRVTTQVKEYRSQPVVVTGAVTVPAVYYLHQNSTTVLELLSEAKGLAATAGDSLLIIRRNRHALPNQATADAEPEEPLPLEPVAPAAGTPADDPARETENLVASDEAPLPSDEDALKAIQATIAAEEPLAEPALPASETPDMIEVDLERLLSEGDMRLNATIYGGDLITVPPAVLDYIYVTGYVNSPGNFPLKHGQTISALRAVAMARGLSPSARAANSFIVTEEEGHSKVKVVNLVRIAHGVDPPVYMKAGDQLVVGSSTFAKLGEFVKPSASIGANMAP